MNSLSPLGEFERDIPLSDAALRYDPTKEKRDVALFGASVVEELLEDGEWHFHGVCGRDAQGRPTLPPGYRWAPDDGTLEESQSLNDITERECHRREMTVAEIAEFKKQGLIPDDVERWYMFFNPDMQERQDVALWP